MRIALDVTYGMHCLVHHSPRKIMNHQYPHFVAHFLVFVKVNLNGNNYYFIKRVCRLWKTKLYGTELT